MGRAAMSKFTFTPFPLAMSIAVFVTCWWVCLFAVLPFGVRNHEEDAEELPEGADPGAPVAPMMRKKILATTALAAVVYCVVILLANFFG